MRTTVADHIVHYLKTHKGALGTGVTALGIANGIQVNFNTVRGRLSEMERAGELVKNASGFYTLPSPVVPFEAIIDEEVVNA